jgi:hypothetical protein
MQRTISWARLKFDTGGKLPAFLLNDKSIADYDPLKKRRKPSLLIAVAGEPITVYPGDVIPEGSLKVSLLKTFYESGILRMADRQPTVPEPTGQKGKRK